MTSPDRSALHALLNDATTTDRVFFAKTKLPCRVRDPLDGEVPEALHVFASLGLVLALVVSRDGSRWIVVMPSVEAARHATALTVNGHRQDEHVARQLFELGCARWFFVGVAA